MSASKRARGVVIAIDGPAGSGKSTLARTLAAELGLGYVNTGIMYRAVAEAALRGGIDPSDGEALRRLAESMQFGFGGDGPASLWIDGRPPAAEQESPEVEASVSQVASHPPVRALLRQAQRDLGGRGAVMEGRDISTVVFPDALVKIFVTASAEVRAARRGSERGDAAAGSAIERRDRLDARTNPLEPAEGAVVIDST